jgi:hypothetical protein
LSEEDEVEHDDMEVEEDPREGQLGHDLNNDVLPFLFFS